MGNWRTVNIKGKVNPDEAKRMIEDLTIVYNFGDEECDFESKIFCCLSMSNSLCGLNQWVQPNGDIDAIGNLFERDFDNDDIENTLKMLVKLYPSLELTLHSGSDYESLECSATFHAGNGEVNRCEPEVEKIKGLDKIDIRKRFLEIL